ncbi:MAG: type II toxin-antitoxin system RelB/DinJ family antitoxin [Devosia sp.]|nr:type II toxin-antitoxin system RelB/DinJ family antitoxin [Devosia sp.]
MSENAVVRARVSEEVKQQATEVLAEMGLTVSDVVRMTLKRVARDRALPFHPDHVPNEETAATLRKSERGEEVHSFASMDEMFKKLGI